MWAGALQAPVARLATVFGAGKALEERLLGDGASASEWLADEDARSPGDDDEVEVDYTYVSRACEAASRLPDVVLTPEDVADLRNLSTDFSISLDTEDEGYR
jgi:hypothetical protein